MTKLRSFRLVRQIGRVDIWHGRHLGVGLRAKPGYVILNLGRRAIGWDRTGLRRQYRTAR